MAAPAKGAPACSPETWNRKGCQDRQVARAAGWGCPVLGEGLVLVPSTSCQGARWTPTAWRRVVDGVQEAERSPVGSRGLRSWKSSTWAGVPVVTSGPGLGGPAGLLCLSVSLPLLVRCPQGALLVPPAHAHPNEPAANLPAGAPGGLTRLSHPSRWASSSRSLLAQALPSPRPCWTACCPLAAQSDRDRDAHRAGT